jgi:rhodanese-related sulfurtransferase
MRSMHRNEIKRRLDEGLPMTLVEVLPQKYFDDGHLPGAVHIPHDAVRELAGKALPDKDATIVVYCTSTQCPNSGVAARALSAMGYRQVYEYVEGKRDWVEAGFPLEATRT